MSPKAMGILTDFFRYWRAPAKRKLEPATTARKLEIFISGTQDDMKPERDAVDRAVNATMLATSIRAETAVSQPQSPRTWIEEQLRECNIYIGVYSHRYGWAIPGENVSATEFEFNLATKLGKPILVWIRNLHEEERTKPDFDRQEQFLNRVSDFSAGYLRQVFDNPAILEKWVASALGETFTEIIQRGTFPIASKFLVPFPHNPDFVGRDTDLETLHEMLQQGKSPVGIRPTVLVGLGGIGKTQLAVEYAHTYREHYSDGIFWLNAANPLLIEFAGLAEVLGLADLDTMRDQAAHKAWEYLDTHTDALVVFDNVLEPKDLNVPFAPNLIPANLRCRTLFTTRQRDFPMNFQAFEVRVLAEVPAMQLLLRSRPEVLQESHPEWGIARVVCASLGWLPLALELAAAYMREYSKVTLNGYLELLRTVGRLTTVDDTKLQPEALPTRHEAAVAATLLTQWSKLDDENARYLFRAAGEFPEGTWISIARLGLLTGIPGELGSPSPLNEVIKRLHNVSLIEELTEELLRLHPLVREFASSMSSARQRADMAMHVAEAYRDLGILESQIIRRGIYAVIEDLRTGLSLCEESGDKDKTQWLLSQMERVLDREAQRLWDWEPKEQPSFFLQQFRNRCLELNQSDLVVLAEAQLAERKLPCLLARFAVGRESGSLVRTLEGHSKSVSKVAVTPGGDLAISASLDGTLRMWHLATGLPIRTLEFDAGQVMDVAATQNGHFVISASVLKNLQLWDLRTGQELRRLVGSGSAATCVAVTPDSRFAISGSEHGTLTVWELATGQATRKFETGESPIIDVAVTPDCRHVVAMLGWYGHEHRQLRMWDLATGQRDDRFMYDWSAQVTGVVAISPDGRFAVSLSPVRKLLLWNLLTRVTMCTLQDDIRTVTSVVLTPDNHLAVMAPGDNTLRVWDVTTGQLVRALEGHTSMVTDVTITPNGRLAVSASDDGTLKVWDLTADHTVRTREGHTGPVRSMAMTSNGRFVLSASGDKSVKEWDAATGHIMRTLEGHIAEVVDVTVTSDNRFAVSVSLDNTIQMWSLETGRVVGKLKGHTGLLTCVAVTPNCRYGVSGSDDGTLKVWDLATSRAIRTLEGHTDSVRAVMVSPDGESVVTASDDKTLKMWNLSTGHQVCTLEGHTGGVTSVTVSPDGQFAVSGSDDATLKMWNLTTRQPIQTLKGHTGPVTDVTVLPNSRFAVSASADKTLKVWDLANSQALLTYATNAPLLCCAATPDGKTFVAGDLFGAVRFISWIGKE